MLCTLAFSGCFDDSVTLGLVCENDLECGAAQACGPGELEDNGSPTPGQVCGIPQDEGWVACRDADPTTCGEDFETALVCRDGFQTETDCDVVCEAQETGERNDGVCGPLVPESDADCACAYFVDDSPDDAQDCVQSDAGLELVRSTTFDSDDAAVYLQTCDEWCKEQTEIPTYEGSVCADTLVDLTAEAVGDAFSAAVGSRLGDEPCVCRLAQEPDCSGGPPQTRCVGNTGTSAVALCADGLSALIQCSDGCGPITVAMAEIDWCL